MTIYNANVSNIRRGLVDCVDPEDDPPFPDTDVQPIAWYQEGGAGGPFAMRVHDSIMAAEIDTDLNAIASSLAALQLSLSPVKTIVYGDVGDVVVAAGTWVGWTAGWVDVRPYRFLGWHVANTGANALAQVQVVVAWDVAGSYSAATAAAYALGAGNAMVGCRDPQVRALDWQYSAVMPWHYIYFLVLGGANPTTCRFFLTGMK